MLLSKKVDTGRCEGYRHSGSGQDHIHKFERPVLMKNVKTFMTLSKHECREVSKACFENAESKYKDALALASLESYGNAMSLLILSMEEMMKATVLSLDAYGFDFRQKVKGIKTIFENHKLRYYLAFILSLINIGIEELRSLTMLIRDKPEAIIELRFKSDEFQQKLMKWILEKIKLIHIEVQWFCNVDIVRKGGTYVDYSDGLKTPADVSEKEYAEMKMRLDKFRSFLFDFLKSFDPEGNDPEMKVQIKKIQRQFISKNYYQKVGEVVSKLDFRINHFESIEKSVIEFITDLQRDIEGKQDRRPFFGGASSASS